MPRKRQPKALAAIQEDEVLETEEQPESAANVAPEVLQLLEEMEQQVQERAQALLDQAEAESRAVMNEFAVQLVKLPKQVRDMPLGQFKTQFGGDISAVLLEDINRRIAASSQAAPGTVARTGAEPATVAAARTTRKRRGDPGETPLQATAVSTATAAKRTRRGRGALEPLQENSGVAETPAAAGGARGGVPFTPAVPATLMRAPVLGEVFYSQKGSPLGVFERDPRTHQTLLNTAVKGGVPLTTPLPGAAAAGQAAVATVFNRKKGSRTGAADSMVVTTSDGEVVTVDLEGGLGSVPAQYREEVAEQLEALRKLATVALNNVTRRR